MIQLCLKLRNHFQHGSCAQKLKFLGLILGIFAVATLANAQTASLTLGSGSGAPGGNVSLNLALSTGGTQPAALQWTLQYSSADITGVSGSIGAAANSAGKSLTCTNATGSTQCVIFGFNQTAIANGALAQLTFTLAPGTTSTSTAIQVTQVVLSDSSGTNIPVSVSGGSITIAQQVTTVVSGLSCNPSSLNPRGTSACVVTLNQAAPGGGASIALISNNASVSVPASVTVSAGATTANFSATAGSFTSNGSAQITASLNGGTASAALTLVTLAQVSALSCSPASLNPHGTSACVVTLNQAAPSGGASIALSSNNASVSVPASVTVSAGATMANFTATAGSFTSNDSAQITASLNGGTASAALTLVTLAQVSALSCSPVSLNPGGTSACVVTLNQAAPSGGASIALSSSSASVSVPSSVAAIAGATTASFTATAGSFTSNGSAQITSSLNGGTASASLAMVTLAQVSALSCSPASLNPGGTSACVVTLNQAAPSGGASIALSSNNASVSVPSSVAAIAGATTASFTAAAGSFTSNGSAQITASLNGGTASASLTLATLAQVSALSCSPASLNPGGTSACVVTLNQAAPSGGASIALSSSSASVSVPASASASAGATTASFTAVAGSFTSNGTVQIKASLNGSAASASLTLVTLAQVSALSCSPASLNPGGTSACVVTLNQPAPSGGASIALKSSSASVSVPASVTATAGATTASFKATAGSFTASGSAQITASLNGQSQAFTLTLTAAPPILVTSITCSPTTFNGGSTSTCKVTLGSAPSVNGSIALSSNAANVTVPSSVAIASGHTTAQLTVSSTLIDVDTNAVVTASFQGSSQSTSLTVLGVRPTALTCAPLTLSAGGSTKCTVQLNRAPQTKAITLLVTSSSTAIKAPQTLATKSQQTQYSFTAKAAALAQSGTVTLGVAYLTSVASTSVSIVSHASPALAAPIKTTATVDTPVTITAQAQDPSGLNVNLSAANLPAGASFTVDDGSAASSATAGVIQWVPQANQVGTYSVSLGAQSSAGTTSQNVTIQVTPQVPQITAVVNAASLSAKQVCSPGSLAIIQGTALQIPSATSGDSADQTSVTVNGVPAVVTDASATQITFLCPANSPSPTLALVVSNRYGVSNTETFTVQSAAPGIFTLDSSGTGQGLILVNGTSNLAALPDPDFASQAAAPGDALTLMMTGLSELPAGASAASVARVTIGGITADVLSLTDVPKLPGMQMLTVSVPQNAVAGDTVPVQVFSQTTSAQSNTVDIAIEPVQ